MASTRVFVLSAFFAVALAAGQSAAFTVGPRLAGTLTNPDGSLVNQMVSIDVELYAAETGGTPAYVESWNSYPMVNGAFNVVLNSGSGVVRAGDDFWVTVQSAPAVYLTMKINGEEFTTRQLVTPMVYSGLALRASNADSLGGVPATGYVTSSVLSNYALLTPSPGQVVSFGGATNFSQSSTFQQSITIQQSTPGMNGSAFAVQNADGTTTYFSVSNTGVVSWNGVANGVAGDAAQLNGHAGGFYQNAANINAGTLDDARLADNICRLDAEQTSTAAKVFQTSGATPAVIVRAAPTGQVSDLTEWTDSSGTPNTWIDSDGFLHANGPTFSDVAASTLAAGTHSNAYTFSNVNNQYTGAGATLQTNAGPELVISAGASQSSHLVDFRATDGTTVRSFVDVNGVFNGTCTSAGSATSATTATSCTSCSSASSLGAAPAASYARLDNSSAQVFTGSNTYSAASSTTFQNQPSFAVASGTAPFAVTSNTKVANLNADLLDGLDSTAFAPTSHSHVFADITDTLPNAKLSGTYTNITSATISTTLTLGTTLALPGTTNITGLGSLHGGTFTSGTFSGNGSGLSGVNAATAGSATSLTGSVWGRANTIGCTAVTTGGTPTCDAKCTVGATNTCQIVPGNTGLNGTNRMLLATIDLSNNVPGTVRVTMDDMALYCGTGNGGPTMTFEIDLSRKFGTPEPAGWPGAAATIIHASPAVTMNVPDPPPQNGFVTNGPATAEAFVDSSSASVYHIFVRTTSEAAAYKGLCYFAATKVNVTYLPGTQDLSNPMAP
jgi:hypothetical protein